MSALGPMGPINLADVTCVMQMLSRILPAAVRYLTMVVPLPRHRTVDYPPHFNCTNYLSQHRNTLLLSMFGLTWHCWLDNALFWFWWDTVTDWPVVLCPVLCPTWLGGTDLQLDPPDAGCECLSGVRDQLRVGLYFQSLFLASDSGLNQMNVI